MGTSGELRAVIAVPPPISRSADGRKQPKKSAREVNPDGTLHAPNSAVTFGILMYVHLALISK